MQALGRIAPRVMVLLVEEEVDVPLVLVGNVFRPVVSGALEMLHGHNGTA